MVGIPRLDFVPKLLTMDGRYASTGLGRGNAYGLAAACGALFPFMMFGRLYWPGSPMTNILFFVTAMLVSSCAGVLGTGVLTIIRLSDTLGITRTPPLQQPSRTGVSISQSYVPSTTEWSGGTADVLLTETFDPCGCWSCSGVVRSF